MSLEKVLLDLKKGKVAPCYLLYGEEEYLIQEALRDILDLLVPPSDRDFGLFFLTEATRISICFGTVFRRPPFWAAPKWSSSKTRKYFNPKKIWEI